MFVLTHTYINIATDFSIFLHIFSNLRIIAQIFISIYCRLHTHAFTLENGHSPTPTQTCLFNYLKVGRMNKYKFDNQNFIRKELQQESLMFFAKSRILWKIVEKSLKNALECNENWKSV